MGTYLWSHSKPELVLKHQDGDTHQHDHTHILGKSSLLSNHSFCCCEHLAQLFHPRAFGKA